MKHKNRKNNNGTRLTEVSGAFLDNLKGKGPVEDVERSMTFHEKRQMDDALTSIFSGCADNVGTPVFADQIRFPSQENAGEISSGGIRLAEMFARAGLRVMSEIDLARMIPVRMLEREVIEGLEQTGAHALARLSRKAVAMSKQQK